MFSFERGNSGHNFPAAVSMPTTASTKYAVGDALVLSSGALVKAGATVKPTYICAETYDAPSTGNKPILVYPVDGTQEWVTTFAADGKTVAIGAAVTLHTDSAQVTATTASGVFTVLRKKGDGSVGTLVVGRF